MSDPLQIRYRPEAFDEVYGNGSMVPILESSIHSINCPTTYLFHGPPGCGKTTIARIVANELGGKMTELNISNTRGIEAARSIIEKCHYSPLDGKPRIIILNEVHGATKDFQNAMLEVLEEPPPNTYFILCTTEPDKLLPAVRSRCSQYVMSPLNRKDMTMLLSDIITAEEVELPPNVVPTIVASCDGSPRNALVMLDKIISRGEDEIKETINQLVFDSTAALDLYNAIMDNKKWKFVAGIISKIDGEPETIRYQLLGLFGKELLRNGSINSYIAIGCFENSFMYSKKAGLIKACFETLQIINEN